MFLPLLIRGAVLVSLWGLLWTRHQVKRLTTSNPPSFCTLDRGLVHVENFKSRVSSFFEKIRQPFKDDVAVTEGEINAWISNNDNFEGNVTIRLAKDKCFIDMCIPVDDLPGGKGRFFIGRVTLSLSSAEPGKTLITVELETLYNHETNQSEKLVVVEFLFYVTHEGFKILNLISFHCFLDWLTVEPDEENFLNVGRDAGETNQDVTALLDSIKGVSIVEKKIIFYLRPETNPRFPTPWGVPRSERKLVDPVDIDQSN